MPPTALHLILRFTSIRTFSTTPPKPASILFALNSLSNSRETQHFNKITKLPRVEHSPPLQLIKSGEVDTYPLPDVAKKRQQVLHSSSGRRRAETAFYNDRALKLGRAILSSHARQTHRLERAVDAAQRRTLKLEAAMMKERQAWEEHRRKSQNEMRIAGIWIVASMGVATGVAMWRFWPEGRSGPVDVGEKVRRKMERGIDVPAAVGLGVGRNVEATASPRAMPIVEPAVGGVAPPTVTAASREPAGEKAVSPAGLPPASKQEVPERAASWWKSLFWKQA